MSEAVKETIELFFNELNQLVLRRVPALSSWFATT